MNNNKNQGFVLWLTGLSMAGKTTIANGVYKILKEKECLVEKLDGDVVRKSLTKDLGFTLEDRNRNIERVTFIAKLLSRNNIGVIASFISPYRKQRARIKRQVNNYIEVFVNAPLDICEKRDKRGFYKKARLGQISNFTGISDPYELPLNPNIELNTNKETIKQSVDKVIEYLENNKYI